MNLFALFFAILISRAKAETSYRDSVGPLGHFKLTALYFADSVLKGLKIQDEMVEGAPFFSIFENFGKLFADQPDNRLKKLSESFTEGLEYGRFLHSFALMSGLDLEASIVEAETRLFDRVKSGKEVSIPAGWVGHAVLMSLAPSTKGSDFFDLRVFNLGDGLQFHEVVADPSGTYPYLVKPWVSYIGIPWKLVEAEPRFFTLGLVQALDKDTMAPIIKESNYFYGELLGNFDAYRAKPSENGKQLFAVAQRSGTCTVSTCMARVMLEHDSIADYNRTRIKLGVFLLKILIENFKDDETLLQMAESDVKFKKVLNFALSSLAREAFNMLSLENVKDQYTCFPTTQKFKAFMTAQDSQTCNAKISTEDFEILKQVTEVSLQTLAWLESIKLDLSHFSTKLNQIDLIYQFKSASFQKILNESETDDSSSIAEHVLSPLPLLNFPKLTSASEVHAAITNSLVSGNEPYFCTNLIKLSKAINYEKDPENYADVNADSWRATYSDMFKLISTEKHVLNMDCLVAFQKISFFIWKVAVLQDSQMGSKSLKLANYAPNVGICNGNGMAVLDDLKEFYSSSSQRIPAYDPELFSESKTFCKLIERESQGKDSLITVRVRAVGLDIEPSFMIRLKDSEEFKKFKIEKGIEEHQSDKFDDMIKCASSIELLQAHPQFYLLELIAFGTSSVKELNNQNLSKENLNFACFYDLTKKDPKAVYWSGTRKDLDGKDLDPAFIYSTFSELYYPNSSLSFLPFMDEMEHVNAANAFKKPIFNMIVDKLLFSSDMLSKAVKERPAFAKRLLSALGGVLEVQVAKLKNSFEQQEIRTQIIRSDLEGFAEFSIIFARTMFRLQQLTGDELKNSIRQYWTDLHGFWYKISGASGIWDTKIRQIIDDAQFGKVNFLLAYLLSLTRKDSNLIALVAPAYGTQSNSMADISAAMAAHYFSGANYFQLTEGKYSMLLDNLYKSRSLLAEVLDEINAKTLNKTLLISLLETFLKRINGESVKFVETTESNPDPDLLDFIHQGIDDTDTKKYKIRISTAEITINGRKLIAKKKFLNLEPFRQFFKKNFTYAANGILTFQLQKVAYEVKSYLAKDADYRLFLQGSEAVKVLRKISAPFRTEYYELRPFDCSQFGLLNTSGLDLYQYKAEKSINFAWISREKSAFTFYGYYNGSVPVLEIPNLNSGPLIFVRNLQSESRDDCCFCSALCTFASGIPFSVYQPAERTADGYKSDDDKTLILLLQPFLVEDGAPLAFKLEGSKLIWLNDPSYILHSEQVINKDEPFSPILILRKESQPKAFIALVPEFDYNKLTNNPEDYAKGHYINVHKMELKADLSGFNAHTRIEKLLLAYHNIRHWNFKAALKLLKRDSIHHNASFNRKEKALLQQIVGLAEIEHPEGIALKMMAAYHFKLDLIEKVDYNDDEEKELNLKELGKAYAMSMRDLSRHYYVHLKFPELTVKELELFNVFPRESDFDANFGLAKVSAPKSMKIVYESSKISAKITDKTIFKDNLQVLAFNQFIKSLYDEKRKDLPEDMVTMTRFGVALSHKDNHGIDQKFWNTLFKLRRPRMSEDLLRSYCLVKGINNEKFTDFMVKIINYFCKHGSGQILEFDTPACAEIIGQEILEQPFNAPKGNVTDQKLFFSLLQDDLSQKVTQKQSNVDDAFDLSALRATNDADVKIFEELSKDIEDNWFKQKPHKSHKPPTSSKTLIQLDTAIDSFDSERRFFDFEALKKSETMKNLNFSKYLADRIAALSKNVKNYKDKLKLKSLNSLDQTTISWILSFFDKIFNQRKENSFETLYSCYFTGSLGCFGNKYPYLTKDELKALRQLTFNYFSETNLLSYLHHVQKLVTELEALTQTSAPDSLAIESVAKDLLFELKKMADFDHRIRHPGLLNFEFKSGSVRLRKEQFDDVLALKAKPDEASLPFSTVIQRMMAAGKTFVLGTLASVLKADGKTLSILVPPSSLYQSNALSMQERTLKFFKSRGKTFHFPRLSVTNYFENLAFLKLILDRIKKTIENKDYLIMDPSDLSAFHNSFIEYFENLRIDATNKNNKKLLKIHAEIYQIFKEQTSIILDEIDMTMAPKLELNYPTQDTEKMNMDAAALTADLFLFTAFNEDIKSAGLQILLNNQHNFDQTNLDKVRGLWQKHVEAKLNEEKGAWYQLIIHPNKVIPDLVETDYAKNVIDFIFEPVLPAKFAAKLEAASKSTHSTLAILRMQVHKWISGSLSGAVFEKYGPSIENLSQVKYAIPYLSANTPNESSVFADRWETLNKTLLMYTVKSFQFEEISALALGILTMKAERDPFAFEIEALFNKVTGVELKGLSFDSNGLITKTFNVNFEAAFEHKSADVLRLIFVYVLKHVMEPIEYFQEQITSNALNMTSMFGSVQGYSGTIDNVNTLPRQLVSIAISERESNEKNNGGIVAKMLDDAYNSPDSGKAVVTVIDSDPQTAVEILKAALKDSNPDSYNAFIDVGAFFKAFTNAQVAEAILQTFTKIQAVIFYDEKSNQTRFMKRGSSTQNELPSTDVEVLKELTKTELEDRFTFYDQRHITGSDIRQHQTAKALLSVGPKVLLRDILQGTLRLRQFMAGQKVHFVTTASVKNLMAGRGICTDGQVKIEDLIALAGANEDEKQNKENVKLAFTKIDNEVRNFVLESLAKDVLNELDTETIVEKFTTIRNLFIRSTREEPSNWLKEIEYLETKQVLQQYIENKLSSLKNQVSDVEKLKKILNDLIPDLKRFLTDLMPQIVSPIEGVELHLEIQQDLNTELGQEIDHAVELLLQNELDNMFKDYKHGSTAGSVRLKTINEHVMTPLDSCLISGKSLLEVISAQEKAIVQVGLGPMNLSFDSYVVDFSVYTKAATVLHPTWAKEGHGFVYFKDEKEGVDSLMLIKTLSMKYLLLDEIAEKTYGPEETKAGKKYCFTDMLGNNIGPDSDEPFLIKSNLFDIPGVKEKYYESFFKAHLFNGAMNYISTLPELREQFGRWLRLLDLPEDKRTESNVRLRLKFLAMKLKGPRKDEFIFDKATDPFIRLLYKTLNTDELKSYHLLLALFPAEMTEENEILKRMNFSAKTNDNIWKHYKPEVMRMSVDDEYEDSEEIEDSNINNQKTPRKKKSSFRPSQKKKKDEAGTEETGSQESTARKSSSVIYVAASVLFLVVIAVVAFVLWKKYQKPPGVEASANLEIDEPLQDKE